MDLDWVDELLSDAREIVSALAREPSADLEALAGEVQAYRAHLHRSAHPLTDLETVDRLTEASLALLSRSDELGDRERGLVSVAVRYFVQRSTDDDDLVSPFGFDDEVEVFNAVAQRVAPSLVLG